MRVFGIKPININGTTRHPFTGRSACQIPGYTDYTGRGWGILASYALCNNVLYLSRANGNCRSLYE